MTTPARQPQPPTRSQPPRFGRQPTPSSPGSALRARGARLNAQATAIARPSNESPSPQRTLIQPVTATADTTFGSTPAADESLVSTTALAAVFPPALAPPAALSIASVVQPASSSLDADAVRHAALDSVVSSSPAVPLAVAPSARASLTPSTSSPTAAASLPDDHMATPVAALITPTAPAAPLFSSSRAARPESGHVSSAVTTSSAPPAITSLLGHLHARLQAGQNVYDFAAPGVELTPYYPEGFHALPPYQYSRGPPSSGTPASEPPTVRPDIIDSGVFRFQLPEDCTFRSNGPLASILGPRQEIFHQLHTFLVETHHWTAERCEQTLHSVDLTTVNRPGGRRFLDINWPDGAPSLLNLPLTLDGRALTYYDCGPHTRKHHVTIAVREKSARCDAQSILRSLNEHLRPFGRVLELWQAFDHSSHLPDNGANDPLADPSSWWFALFAVLNELDQPAAVPRAIVRDMPGWISIGGEDKCIYFLHRFAYCTRCKNRYDERHSTKKCPRAACFGCGQTGHLQRDCPGAPSSNRRYDQYPAQGRNIKVNAWRPYHMQMC